MTKMFLCFKVFILFSNALYTQTDSSISLENIDSIYPVLVNKIEYGLIEKGKAFVTIHEGTLKICNLHPKTQGPDCLTFYKGYIPHFYLPMKWLKSGERLIGLRPMNFLGNIPAYVQMDTRFLVKEDSIEYDKSKSISPSIKRPVYHIIKVYQMRERVLLASLNMIRSRPSPPTNAEKIKFLNKYYGRLSYDFFQEPEESEVFKLYIRDDRHFTVWNYHYPQGEKDDQLSNYKEQVTYFKSDSQEFTKNKVLEEQWLLWPEHKALLPSPEKTHFHVIADTSFFYGHFKVIRQKGNYFIINQHHGAIYYLGKNTIDKVGQIALEEQRFTLWGQKTFIEDLDKGELLFFTSVQQLGKPFPKIKVMTEEKAFREKFRLVPK